VEVSKRLPARRSSISQFELAAALQDHEQRIRQLEVQASRIMGALLFLAAEIPVVLAVGMALIQRWAN